MKGSAISPEAWLSAATCTIESDGVTHAASARYAAAIANRLPCVRRAPFGAPVVPEVKKIQASSVSARRSGSAGSLRSSAASSSSPRASTRTSPLSSASGAASSSVAKQRRACEPVTIAAASRGCRRLETGTATPPAAQIENRTSM